MSFNFYGVNEVYVCVSTCFGTDPFIMSLAQVDRDAAEGMDESNVILLGISHRCHALTR